MLPQKRLWNCEYTHIYFVGLSINIKYMVEWYNFSVSNATNSTAYGFLRYLILPQESKSVSHGFILWPSLKYFQFSGCQKITTFNDHKYLTTNSRQMLIINNENILPFNFPRKLSILFSLDNGSLPFYHLLIWHISVPSSGMLPNNRWWCVLFSPLVFDFFLSGHKNVK